MTAAIAPHLAHKTKSQLNAAFDCLGSALYPLFAYVATRQGGNPVAERWYNTRHPAIRMRAEYSYLLLSQGLGIPVDADHNLVFWDLNPNFCVRPCDVLRQNFRDVAIGYSFETGCDVLLHCDD